MNYRSTRGNVKNVKATQAIIQGLASDGGLFVPETLPTIDILNDKWLQQTYEETAYSVMAPFLEEFDPDELKECIYQAYKETFNNVDITPIKKVGDDVFLELFHGPTLAFKDVALSILPHLLTASLRKQGKNQHSVILTATSGDTGKAAMAGFCDVPGTSIFVFYPKDGVSQIQEKQMLTQTGNNTYVIGLKGNFDEAQQRVKAMLEDEELAHILLEQGYQFSSANSINIGRLLPQMVYYVYSYFSMVKQNMISLGESINISVPTGNFGNILAAYYVKQMGVPINRLICASNKNNVLTDFFLTGRYDANRPFYVTNAPSMDILVSSNLERLLYLATKKDTKEVVCLMNQLNQRGSYTVSKDVLEELAIFYPSFVEESAILEQIKTSYTQDNYVVDPHTAVAQVAAQQYREETQDYSPMLIAATASPYKFSETVITALDGTSVNLKTDLDRLSTISQTEIPREIASLEIMPIRHNQVIEVDDMRQTVLDMLGIH